MLNIFISHSHKDSQHIATIKSIRKNPNHSLRFEDYSLPAPVYNSYGHVNRRPPNDPVAREVKVEINRLLEKTDKLLVLVGKDTHSSLWVQWEIESFVSKFGWKNVFLMRTPDNVGGGAPANASHRPLYNWSVNELTKWVFA